MLENNLENLIKNYQPNQAASDVVQRTKIVLLVGISGAGKDTVKRRLLEDNDFADIVSYTTRQPRQNAGVLETPGVVYHFIDEAPGLGWEIVKKLKDIVPRQSFEVSLQAAIGGKFIARENIGAYRKDVTGYLYGGDVSRKKKLLAKQARGKKRMKRFGKVDIPSEAFMVMLKRD